MAFRRYLLASTVAVLSSLVACGGDDGQPTPEGTHYHYVANQVFVPTTSTQVREYGLDINGDGTFDNALGTVLSNLASFNFDVQGALDASIASGTIVLLGDFQTKDFTNSGAAGFQVFLGGSPTPAACNAGEMYDGTTKTGCKRHLDGNGSFTVEGGTENAAVAGKIVNGTFNGGPGELTLQIALGGTDPIVLNLIGARVRASGISETGIENLILAGAVTKTDIDNNIIPAIQTQLGPIIARDCTMLSSPPGCGCSGTGGIIIGMFDEDNNCAVSVDEIKNNNTIVSLLGSDVTIDGQESLSVGVKATTVKGTFSVAGQ